MSGRQHGNTTEQASSTCYLDEADSAYSGITSRSAADAVSGWRDRERSRLIGVRRAMTSQDRAEKTARIAENLQRLIGGAGTKVVSLYWPIRGEPDLRMLLPWVEETGGKCCLPVVVEKGQALAFHSWTSTTPMKRTIWSLAEPADGHEVAPDIILAPVIGIDREGYRLGYGGGYFDRTLAVLRKPAMVIGIGFTEQKIRTIYPQPHDIPMNWIVTDGETTEVKR